MTTGDIVTVENTPMDFRTAKAIGRDIEADYIQVRNGKGYDHNWVLNTAGDMSQPALRLEDPQTGIVLE